MSYAKACIAYLRALDRYHRLHTLGALNLLQMADRRRRIAKH